MQVNYNTSDALKRFFFTLAALAAPRLRHSPYLQEPCQTRTQVHIREQSCSLCLVLGAAGALGTGSRARVAGCP